MAASSYTFLISNALTGVVIEEMPFQQVRYAKGRKQPGSLTASIPTRHPKATEANLLPVRNVINVLKDGVVYWCGPIWQVNADDLFGNMVVVQAEGMFSFFTQNRRKIRTDFDFNGDVCQWANELILLGQSYGSDYNLNIGVNPLTNTDGRANAFDYSVSFEDQHCIGDDIIQYANAGKDENGIEQGFDFDIIGVFDGTKFSYQFVMGYPTFATPWVHDLAAFVSTPPQVVDVNSAQVAKYGIRKDGKQMTRRMDVIGSDGSIVTVDDTINQGRFPIIEDDLKLDLVWDDNYLFALGENEIERRMEPFSTPMFTTDVTKSTPVPTWEPGSNVTVVGGIGYTFAGSRTVQIESWEVTVDDQGHDVATVQFKDLPAGVKSFDYIVKTSNTPKPTVTLLSPNNGPSTGGTQVIITGTNFINVINVYFGGTAASWTKAPSSTTVITATAPPGTGIVDVTVQSQTGTSNVVLADKYTYNTVSTIPVVNTVTPNSGTTAGGTSVTVNGSNFTTANTLKIGTTVVGSFTIVNDTTITFTTPAGTAGSYDITVTNPSGTSTTSSADLFTYVDLSPTVSGVSPTSGDVAGGTSVNITGSRFTGATSVKFGGVAASTFTVNSSTSITATSPAQAIGTYDIRVTTPNGISAITPADQFTYTSTAGNFIVDELGDFLVDELADNLIWG